jgi:hypothetical protein
MAERCIYDCFNSTDMFTRRGVCCENQTCISNSMLPVTCNEVRCAHRIPCPLRQQLCNYH